jgi:putative ABC transport system permease protein
MNELLLGRVAFRSLLHHKGRAILTMLGIIIGIGAIIATLAIGRGAEKKIHARITSMGENYLFVIPGNLLISGKTVTTKRKPTEKLRKSDVDTITKLLPTLSAASPMLSVQETVGTKNKYVSCEVKGGNETFLDILRRDIAKGVEINAQHVKKASKVVVLGKSIAESLFDAHTDPVGKKIKVGSTICTVIGVIAEIKDFFGFRDPNNDLFMPEPTMRQRLLKTHTDVVHGIAIKAASKEELPTVQRQVRRILRDRHMLRPNDPDDFTIFDQQSMAKAAEEASGILQLLLLIIASISLVVGGVGVMNIMLVSVTERTREIGVRMALGATGTIILRQFLYEALSLCLVGGTLGVILGGSLPMIFAWITGWEGEVTLVSIVAAFGVTTAVGLFFGYYPARKAARMNPVDALAER